MPTPRRHRPGMFPDVWGFLRLAGLVSIALIVFVLLVLVLADVAVRLWLA